MLQNIRDKSQGAAAKIFIGFVILVFGLWGVETLVGTLLNAAQPAATVNGVEITENELAVETQRRTSEMISSMGPDVDPSQINETLIRETALNQLIQQTLLLQAAESAGMTVSPRTIDRQIASIPDFQVDGVFNNQRAQTILQSAGYTPSTFRQSLRQETLLNQLMIAYSGSGFVTPHEIEALASLTEQTRDFRHLRVNMESRAQDIEISEEDIETYYQENQSQFMREEQVALNYLELDRRQLAEDVEVSDERIQARYDQEVEAFQSDIERRASHILLETVSERSEEEVLELARELRQRIDEGAEFEELAAEYSDDTGSAEDGGDVGYTTGDSFVEEFEQALAELETGEVSEPVVTDFGVHLIKLTESGSTEFESLEQARERLARELRLEEAGDLYNARAEELSNLAFESLDLEAPAEAMGLEIRSTELFGRSGGAGIAAEQAVVDEAFSPYVLEDGLNSELIAVDDNRSVVIHVTEHNPAAVRDLSEVSGEIETILRGRRVAALAEETGQRIVERLRAGEPVDELLEENGLEWMQAENVGRTGGQISPELIDRVFSMPRPGEEGSTVAGFVMQDGTYAVVEMQQVTPGSLEDLSESDRQSMEGFVAQQSGMQAFNAYLESLSNRAEIER